MGPARFSSAADGAYIPATSERRSWGSAAGHSCFELPSEWTSLLYPFVAILDCILLPRTAHCGSLNLYSTATNFLAAMARQPGLPFDVLLVIIEISLLPTAARMTRKCHTLHDGGARFLLDSSVPLGTEGSAISFVQFMSADPLHRFQHLRTLELACGKISPPAVDALLGLISHSWLALDSLTLQDADAMLESTSALVPSSSDIVRGRQVDALPLLSAIAELTTIQRLNVFGDCGPQACKLIKAIRLPLRTVSHGVQLS